MKFSIITPSFNMLPYLKLCHNSVIDQNHSNFEHIIIDGNSNDNTKIWLKDKNLNYLSENDSGMYDALNKGLSMADGDIISYLNCDEQYLPGTLNIIKKFFINNPTIDIVFGHALITKPDGSLICFRKAYQPRKYYIMASHLYVLSCTMFFRSSILDQGFLFNTKYKSIGDMHFVLELLNNGFKAKYIEKYLSSFTWTGNNLSSNEVSKNELFLINDSFPKWIHLFKKPINFLRLTEKTLSGAYFTSKPLEYKIYVKEDPNKRNHFSFNNIDFRWPT